jgi:murein L,D-transpeptidase YafK
VDEEARRKNTTKSRVRAKVEHPFRILKHIFGFDKVRYRGINKNHHRLCVCFALINLYPTPEQVRQAQARGVDPGGDIMVHGIRNGLGWLGSLQRQVDWTKGCIAVTDGEIDEFWRLVPDGTPIEIDR